MLLLSHHLHLGMDVPLSCTEVRLHSRYRLVYQTGVSYTMSTPQSSFGAITLEIKGTYDALGNHGVVQNRKDHSFVLVIAVTTSSA